MKLLFITDTHFGGKDLTGYHQQPRYPEQIEELLFNLDKVVKAEEINLIIHGGDLTDNATPIEISKCARMYSKYLSCPAILALGNHDCLTKECCENFLQYGRYFFPTNSCDSTLIFDDVRIDVLSINWAPNSKYWKIEDGSQPSLGEEHFTRLSSGNQMLPRVLVMHSNICPKAIVKDNAIEYIHQPNNNFDKVASNHIEKFQPKLILTGHTHLNQLDKINNSIIVGASSFVEMPFDYKVIEITKEKLKVKTLSLSDNLSFKGEYYSNKQYVQGTTKEREIEVFF